MNIKSKLECKDAAWRGRPNVEKPRVRPVALQLLSKRTFKYKIRGYDHLVYTSRGRIQGIMDTNLYIICGISVDMLTTQPNPCRGTV